METSWMTLFVFLPLTYLPILSQPALFMLLRSAFSSPSYELDPNNFPWAQHNVEAVKEQRKKKEQQQPRKKKQ